jgi:hypothetical protein
VRPPRSVAERLYANIQRWTVMEGGHFAAFEQSGEGMPAEALAAAPPYDYVSPSARRIG